jgi:hypothetical protein
MQREFYVQLVCPHCFRSKWIIARILVATCESLFNRRWQLECPVHGRVRVKPLQVHEKRPVIPLAEITSRWLQ